jgi:hypothetical protein
MGNASANPLMTEHDLGDPRQFLRVSRVPLLDVHDDPEHGKVDEPLLHLLARNSNDRARRGDPAALTLGHTKRKHSVILVRPDGSKVVFPGAAEADQPAVVGYAKNYVVAPFRGRACLHGDFFVYRKYAEEARGYPWRSVERLEPNNDSAHPGDMADHLIDRIALLRTAPRRDPDYPTVF